MLAITLLLAYLLGSIPSGWLAGWWCKGIDLRQSGSGSTGATNVLRSVGKGAALVVLLADVLKGSVAVLLTRQLSAGPWLEVVAGLLALAGHTWPVWLGFRGGKAVATGLGMLLGLVPAVGFACLGVFAALLGLFRIVSLASLAAALALPLLMAVAAPATPAYLSLALLTAALVVWRHRANMLRLLAGTEPRLGGSGGSEDHSG
ncbi:MAG: glycerol-3-phosphate 1-O-acyltransferase PlsY [Aphanocapsa feldmannii 277cV]|uniref:Glycerol-3-phosphate acyltransferase n=2 Tax=Aphanocapsa feldmannii TaxID=192050 RepID=A0A524RP03_9CHRO|nr:MAG: glycerol-3-phosphate 1-O-acyltransferase PlsY [Aphanocapsa feldmannii 277cV]TGH23254.1 MAG: glycerol-3-phosphate 1-O-acyltransferase PlsY [Aphanocapsa feldmannii 277cI]